MATSKVVLPDNEERTLIGKVFTKLVKVMTDIFIMKNGDVISLDINYPYLVKLDKETTEALFYLFDDFGSMIHIPNAREFKKYVCPSKADFEKGIDLEEYRKKALQVRLNSERSKVLARTQYYYDLNGILHDWHKLDLSEAQVKDIFVENNYFQFTPEDADDVPVILTKEAFPLVTEKNANIVEYSARQYSNELNLISFRCDIGLFTSQSFNFYIPMVKKDS